MNNTLIIDKIKKINNKIEINLIPNGLWKKIINSDFFASYEENIEKVPDGIAVIPLICNILPISWLFDLEIKVSELDQKFYESIDKIKAGYKEMYPNLEFKGTIHCENIIQSEEKNYGSKRAVLFSGGVDAVTTMLRHTNEDIDLITIFGADISLDDKKGIANVDKQHIEISRQFNHNYYKIFSNFRAFINSKKLTNNFKKYGYEWWHEFQHGIGIIGLVAPLSYCKKYEVVYIASSYHISHKGNYTCASDPIIDNQLKYNKTITNHDGYELTRQQKIEYICNYVKNNNISGFNLRVCWESSGGSNCCNCEKCRRTYLAILAEKDNPSRFGLKMNDEAEKKAIKFFKKNLKYRFNEVAITYYIDIQKAYIKNITTEETPKNMLWFRSIKIGNKKKPLIRKVLGKIKYTLRDLIKR